MCADAGSVDLGELLARTGEGDGRRLSVSRRLDGDEAVGGVPEGCEVACRRRNGDENCDFVEEESAECMENFVPVIENFREVPDE